MKTFFILLLLAVLLSCGNENNKSSSYKNSYALKDYGYMALLNEHRMRMGLPPLTYLKSIEISATQHSMDMAEGRRPFGHEGWKERCKILKDLLKSKACGEIVAAGQDNGEEVLESWLRSPPHRDSIEHPSWTHTGLGVFRNKNGRLYWTQIFLKLQ